MESGRLDWPLQLDGRCQPIWYMQRFIHSLPPLGPVPSERTMRADSSEALATSQALLRAL